jgi:ABC-2 type transport system ATP-binding protein
MNVKKSFKDFIALKDINVEFDDGMIHGIIGRNGSGKTVLMKCICGFMPVDNGEITVNSKRIGIDCDVAPSTGIIIEVPGFLANYTAYQNLKFLADINGVISKKVIRETIQFVGLSPYEKKRVGKFSLGMKQRLALAQAIMENPDTFILDEPMNGLDKDGVQDMRKYLLELKSKGKTILIASHSAEDIEVLCDSVYEMDKGSMNKIK